MKLFQIAHRNLTRNKRRSLLTVAAISFGLTAMIATITIQYGSYDAIIRAGVSQLAGHVVVQAKGWQADREEQQLVLDATTIERRLVAHYPNATVVRRVFLKGLLSSPLGSVGVGLSGIEPSDEANVQTLDEKLIAGEWLHDVAGSSDRSARSKLVIGQKMAEILGVEVGDKVVYMGQHQGNESVSQMFRIGGVFRTGAPELDQFVAFAPIEATQSLMNKPNAAHQVSVHFDDPTRSEAAALWARKTLGTPQLEVLSWREALPEINAYIRMDRASGSVMMVVIGLIVGLGVLNTVLMSILERTREFGVMLSIGLKPQRLALLVMFEGLFLGLLGALGGLLFGGALSWYLVEKGLDMSASVGGDSFETVGVTIDSVIYGGWDPRRIALYALMSVVCTTLAAVYPAIRVAQLKPVDAMRHI